MPIKFLTRIHVTPQDRFIFVEDVRIGQIDPREAYVDLIMDIDILVDDKEIDKISAIPEVANRLKEVKPPERPQYKPTDWRAKTPYMREVQWQKKPIIDYIATKYKTDVIEAVKAKFDKLPAAWANELTRDVTYRLEPRALQLSPTQDKKWRYIYVQTSMNLGSAEESSGFIGKFVNEFEAAVDGGNIIEKDGQKIFKSSLTGFESLMKELDPYAGVEMTAKTLTGPMMPKWEIPDEPGYDKEIREGFYDQMNDAMGTALGEDVKVNRIDDAGNVYFTTEKLPTPLEIPE